MSRKVGRVPSEPGSREPSPDGLAPSGFDPSRERLTETETQVYFLLRKYRVQKHYRATSAAGTVRYAVWAHAGGQITQPTTNAEARAAADRLTAKDIVRAVYAATPLRTAGHALAEALGALITATDGDERLRGHRQAGLDALMQFEGSLRDSDGSPEGEKPQALSAEHDSAGPKDIAHD